MGERATASEWGMKAHKKFWMSKGSMRSFLEIGFLFSLFVTNSSSAFGQTSALDQASRALYRGDYTKASEVAAGHLRKFPSDVPVRVILARADIAEGKVADAFQELRKALASDPRNIDALFYLSLLAKEFSHQEGQRLISLAPDSDRAHQLLAEAALAAANQNEAETEFENALKANPHSIAVLTELAELKQSQFKFDEAINYYSQAEALDPSDYRIAYGLGSCYSSKQAFPEAVEWFRKALAIAPRSAAGRFALGDALVQNAQFEAAIPELKASLEIDPKLTEAYLLLGRAYLKLGRREEAKAVFRRFNELNRAEMHGEQKSDGAPSQNNN